MRETYENWKLKPKVVYFDYLTDSVGNVTECSVYALHWIMFMTLFFPQNKYHAQKEDYIVTCLFDCVSSYLLREFHSNGHVTIVGEGKGRTVLCSWSLTRFICYLAQRRRDIHNCCRTFNTGSATACFDSFGLSRPEFEHPTFRMWGIHVCFNKCPMSYKGKGDRLSLFIVTTGHNVHWRQVGNWYEFRAQWKLSKVFYVKDVESIKR